jgi:hypothetical protein
MAKKEQQTKLDLIVDQVQKRTDAQHSSTLKRLSDKHHTEETELLRTRPLRRAVEPALGR